jgi:hypothetical protein
MTMTRQISSTRSKPLQPSRELPKSLQFNPHDEYRELSTHQKLDTDIPRGDYIVSPWSPCFSGFGELRPTESWSFQPQAVSASSRGSYLHNAEMMNLPKHIEFRLCFKWSIYQGCLIVHVTIFEPDTSKLAKPSQKKKLSHHDVKHSILSIKKNINFPKPKAPICSQPDIEVFSAQVPWHQ